jgi:3'-5' exonuclease
MKRKLLYYDMEWVPISRDFETLETEYPNHAGAWSRRCDKWRSSGKFKPEQTDSEIYDIESGFYPEYIKIICISCGYYKGDEMAIDSFYGHDEAEILERVATLFHKISGKYDLCGHSIKRYDMPFLAKRLAINGIPVPYNLNNGKKKPWDLTAVDIAEEWSFGCMQEKYTPLDWICVSLGVDTPKTDISGAQVKDAYYNQNRLEDIKDYCERDVIATAEVEQKIYAITNPQKIKENA